MATQKKTANAKDVIALFERAFNDHWGYIWGKSGEVWTQANQNAATREQTVKWGSKWVGHRVADCSGIFTWAYNQLGSYMYHGSNTMWAKYCTAKGALSGGARTDGKELRPGTAIYLTEGENRYHVGLYVGEGVVIEARGTYYGVVKSQVDRWNEWGELINTDYDNVTSYELGERTLRVGCIGDDVRDLQRDLINLGYPLGNYGEGKNGVDGNYGSKTESAVKSFQLLYGLDADGIFGEKTYEKLMEVLSEPKIPNQYRLTILGTETELKPIQAKYGGTLEKIT